MYNCHFTMLYFTISFEKSGKLPMYKSSAIRGGMGKELLRQYCLWDHEKCEECLFRKKCIVQSVMYAPYEMKPDFVQSGESAGYSLSCTDLRENVKVGDRLEFRMVLYGDTAAFFHPILQAVHGLGMRGLGKEHLPFQLQHIRNVFGEDILTEYDVLLSRVKTLEIWDYISMRKEEIGEPEEIYLKFLTPCAVSYKGDMMREFQVEALFRSVWRRVYMQHLFEGILVEPQLFFEMPVMLGQEVEICSVGRHSSKSREKTDLAGVTGYVKLGNVSYEVLKVLLAGEITCIGKNIRFGFGVYHVSAEMPDS